MYCITCRAPHEEVNIYREAGEHFPALIDKIIAAIRVNVPARKIFLLGSYFDKSGKFQVEYDLLVLIESRPLRPMFEFERLITDSCKNFAKVTASVDKCDQAMAKMKDGNIFYNKVCNNLNQIYNADQRSVFIPGVIRERSYYDILIAEFNFLLFKAKGFLSGAINYNESGDYALAAFMLHQSVEQSLGAYLAPLMGYRLQTHNINKLLFYARRFSPDFGKIFPLDSELEISLYQILHKAYIWGRYRGNFKVGPGDICLLIDKAKLLVVVAEDNFHQNLYE